jgi:hypothetical protein
MYARGLEPGARFEMKTPLQSTSGDGEYVWVRVTGWTGSTVRGTLLNRPLYVPGVHMGDELRFEESTMFDYLLEHPDGRIEGNETTAILAREHGGA